MNNDSSEKTTLKADRSLQEATHRAKESNDNEGICSLVRAETRPDFPDLSVF